MILPGAENWSPFSKFRLASPAAWLPARPSFGPTRVPGTRFGVYLPIKEPSARV